MRLFHWVTGLSVIVGATMAVSACDDDENTTGAGGTSAGGSNTGGSNSGGSNSGGGNSGGSNSGGGNSGGGNSGGSNSGGSNSGGSNSGGSAQGGSGGQPTDPSCGAPATAPSNGTCALENGNLPGTFACNPVTNEGCSGGEACDVLGTVGFDCFSGNTADLCEACDQQASSGPFCTEGTTCFRPDGTMSLDKCARYCCDDGDCGGGVCVKAVGSEPWFVQAPNIGVCLE